MYRRPFPILRFVSHVCSYFCLCCNIVVPSLCRVVSIDMFLRICVSYRLIKKKSSYINSNNNSNSNSNSNGKNCESKSMLY